MVVLRLINPMPNILGILFFLLFQSQNGFAESPPTPSQLLIDASVKKSTPYAAETYIYKIRYRYASVTQNGKNAKIQVRFPDTFHNNKILSPLPSGNITSVTNTGLDYTVHLASPTSLGFPSGTLAAGSSGIIAFEIQSECGPSDHEHLSTLIQNPIFTISGVSNTDCEANTNSVSEVCLILDNTEICDNGIDDDNRGLVDFENEQSYLASSGIDSDSDSYDDDIDEDDDNDGILDVDENGGPSFCPTIGSAQFPSFNYTNCTSIPGGRRFNNVGTFQSTSIDVELIMVSTSGIIVCGNSAGLGCSNGDNGFTVHNMNNTSTLTFKFYVSGTSIPININWGLFLDDFDAPEGVVLDKSLDFSYIVNDLNPMTITETSTSIIFESNHNTHDNISFFFYDVNEVVVGFQNENNAIRAFCFNSFTGSEPDNPDCIQNSGTGLDTDGDGIPNHLDLDSDNDGCPDALEGGASFGYGDLTSIDRLSGSVGSTGIPTAAGVGQSIGNSQNSSTVSCPENCYNGIDDDNDGLIDCDDPDCYLVANSGGTDFDGDGYDDNCDEDDDNDGILDVDENLSTSYCPSIGSSQFPSFNYSNCTSIPGGRRFNNVGTFQSTSIDVELVMVSTSGIIVCGNSAGLGCSNGDNGFTVHNMNNTSTLTFKFYESGTSTPISINWGLFLDDFDSPEGIVLDKNLSFSYILNNLNPMTITETNTSIIFESNHDTEDDISFYFYDVDEVVVGFQNQNNVIRAFCFNSLTGNEPNNPVCVQNTATGLDTDGDGFPNHLDLDSDDDGCPDAIEGGGSFTSSNLNADDELTGAVGTNGVPNQAGSGQTIGSSQNDNVNNCTEICNNGIDDDGDGVIDCPSVTGVVFEDINYGGGLARPYSVSNTSALASGWANDAIRVPNVRIELYDDTGAFVTSTTTNSNGGYAFSEVAAGDYTVRVVNSTVSSNRASNSTGETIIPVQTFRQTASTGYYNEIGGANPALEDAPANTTNANLSSLTTSSTTAQSINSITVGTSNVVGNHFGFNFSTITNTNDSGQGSLRQFIINSNELANTNLDQEDSPTSGVSFPKSAGWETSIFMIPGTSTHTIQVASQYDWIEDEYTHITGYTQNGSSQGTINARTINVELVGTSSFVGLTLFADNVQLSGLAMHTFTKAIYSRKTGGTNTFVWGNYIGMQENGLTAASNSSDGVEYENITNSFFGTNGDNINDVNEGNIVSNSYGGITIDKTSNVLVAGNYIGTDKTGTVDHGNTYIGIAVYNSTGANYIGYNDALTNTNASQLRNVSAGNGTDGIRVVTADNQVITGNYLGVDATGLDDLGNGGYGIHLQGTINNITIGTNSNGDSDDLERNIISGNGTGFRTLSSASGSNITIQGNYIGTDKTGNAALPNNTHGLAFYGDFTNTIVGTNGDGIRDDIEGNIISGNGNDGIRISSSDDIKIAGNKIGITANGSALGNAQRGIYITGTAANNKIGYYTAMTNTDELIVGNQIKNNAGTGIGISSTSGGNLISRNQLEDNGGIGIDLGYDGVTANDNGDGDTGSNTMLNFPVILSAELSGNNLTVIGFAPASATVEFFIADAAPNPSPLPIGYSTSFGEGAEYLFHAVEGSLQDNDNTTGSYTNDGTGASSTKTQNKFSFSFDVTGLGLTTATRITATATDNSDNTSEFNGITTLTTNEICNDGIDNDGDGDIDCADSDCAPNITNVTSNQPTCPSGNNGSINVTATVATGTIEYRLNGTGSYQSSNLFNNLSSGSYTVQVRKVGTSCTFTSPLTITLTSPPCIEICSDGIDNDGDGDIDCADSDCIPTISNVNPIQPSCPNGNNGTITVTANIAGGTVEYRLNTGAYQSSNSFSGLSAGTYTVQVRNVGSSCTETWSSNIVFTTPTSCSEICNDGIDNDGNGDIDCDDAQCSPSIISVSSSPSTCPCNNNNASIAINASGTVNMEYSVDGGLSYVSTATISNLTPGSYNIAVRNPDGGCTSVYSGNPLVIATPNCVEICNNGIDDDCDGQIDCDDDSCKPIAPSGIILD